jgi:glycosyltransferase involved in cell wall biosynthesis
MIDCSVVVPTFLRPELLDRCLGALATQTLEPSRYEIVVADDAGSPETLELVTRWARVSDSRIRYVAGGGDDAAHGPAAARNAGWQQALGEVIAFTDDDTIPTPGWLAAGLDTIDREELCAGWGRVVVPLPDRPRDADREAAGAERAGFAAANCFVRRDVLESLGGFDEAFRLACREDSDLFLRLVTCEHRVAQLDGAVVVHPVRRATWGASLRQQRKAAYEALLYKKHRHLYQQYVQPGRPVLYYPTVLALAGIGYGATVGGRAVTELATGLWALLTLWLALQRLRGTSHAPADVAEVLVTSALVPPVSIFWRVVGALKYRVFYL